jgi:hypothetical protein
MNSLLEIRDIPLTLVCVTKQAPKISHRRENLRVAAVELRGYVDD